MEGLWVYGSEWPGASGTRLCDLFCDWILGSRLRRGDGLGASLHKYKFVSVKQGTAEGGFAELAEELFGGGPFDCRWLAPGARPCSARAEEVAGQALNDEATQAEALLLHLLVDAVDGELVGGLHEATSTVGE